MTVEDRNDKENAGNAEGRSENRHLDVVTGIPTETISQRAYTLFQARGSTHGHDVEDWLVAEAELQNGTNTEVTSPSADTLRRLG